MCRPFHACGLSITLVRTSHTPRSMAHETSCRDAQYGDFSSFSFCSLTPTIRSTCVASLRLRLFILVAQRIAVRPIHFLYISDTRDHGYDVPSHLEELMAAALLHLLFQARHGFVPRRCLMTEVSLRPNCHVFFSAVACFFLPHLSYVGRPCVEILSRRHRTSFPGLGDLTFASLTALFRINSSRKVATRAIHTVICDRDGPLHVQYSHAVGRPCPEISKQWPYLISDNVCTDSLKLRRNHRRHETAINLEFLPQNKPGSACPSHHFYQLCGTVLS